MEIIAFSDVHGDVHKLLTLSNEIEHAEKALFLGDGINTMEVLDTRLANKIIAVKGNCDLFCPLPEELVIELAGKKIFMTHGHNYDVKISMNKIAAKALEVGADITLFGHTHVYQQKNNIVNVPAVKDGKYIKITLGKEIKIELKHIN